mgnify:FL=1
MEENNITLNKTLGKVIKIACLQCDLITNHEVISSVNNLWGDDYGMVGATDFEVVQCKGCEMISFRSASTCSEDIDGDPVTGEPYYPVTENLYPNRMVGKKVMKDSYLLPYPVSEIYTEVHDAMCRSSRILASIGVRILVEAICKLEGAKGTNLEKKIDNLVQKGILTADNAETLHSTRLLGNRSAHEGEQSSTAEIAIAMDIVENLMHRVYIIPKKASKLPRRRLTPTE